MAFRTFRWAAAGLVFGLSLVACEGTDIASLPGTSPSPPTPPGTVGGPSAPRGPSKPAFAFRSSGDANFDLWRDQFAAMADAAGRSEASIILVLEGLTPIEASVQTQTFDNQAEFVKPIWDYAKSALSPTRISNGQAKLVENAAVFDAIEATYAAPREILAAIWGMESAYGAVIGDLDAPQALASQAAVGRRKDFNETELMALMQLIEDGSATREQFHSASWAGALGQMQFMPSTFLAYGRDHDRDGRKDLWANAGDALASAANYLSVYGWKQGEPWALEVVLPEAFDYAQADGRKLTVSAWRTLGLGPATRAQIAAEETLPAELFLPAGVHGPAFLLFENFAVIKKYNNADSYALAVGILADRLAGGPDLRRPWPKDIAMLTQIQAQDLQAALNKLGYNAGAVDGVIGRGTRGALQKFQKDKGLLADGFPTTDMLDQVVAAAA